MSEKANSCSFDDHDLEPTIETKRAMENNNSLEKKAAEEYFAENSPPPSVIEKGQQLTDFVRQLTSDQDLSQRPVVCVSSGGTKVALERNTVRYIDNFSSGLRGAASVEHFLSQGYAVIYLRREGSRAPFARHFQDSTSLFFDDAFLRKLEVQEDGTFALRADPASQQRLSDVIKFAKQSAPCLLTLEFDTVDSYFFLLRAAAESLSPLGSRVCFYLAAAVSDFYVPRAQMATHKIQSSSGPLVLHLANTPKLLGLLRWDLCPQAFYVSFKLETDPEILLSKARKAIANYGMHLVVANSLATRNEEVVLVTSDTCHTIMWSRAESRADTNYPKEIEVPLVSAVVQAHASFRLAPIKL
jgi:phosphopantothenate-cysteine ligase